MERRIPSWHVWVSFSSVMFVGFLVPALPRIIKANGTGVDYFLEITEAFVENVRPVSEIFTNLGFFVTVGVICWIYEWVMRLTAKKGATFTSSQYKKWFRTYLAIEHGCDHRILNALRMFDNGPHGRSVTVCHDELIRDVCVFFTERNFKVHYLGTGWKTSHLEWQISHDDGRMLVIHAQDKFQLDPYAAKQSWPTWGHFAFLLPGGVWCDIYRGWQPSEDGPKATIQFRKRLFAALWDFVALEKTK